MIISHNQYLTSHVIANYQILQTISSIEKIVWRNSRDIDCYGTLITPFTSSKGLIIYCRGGYGDTHLSLNELAHSASPILQCTKAGYHVLALEYTGTGGSDGFESCNGFDQIADIVDSTKFALTLGFETAILIGASRGADAVLLAANTGKCYISKVIAASGLYDLTTLKATRPDLYHYISKYISIDEESLKNRSIISSKPVGLKYIQTILVHGDIDTRSPVSHAYQLSDKLINCPKTLLVYKNMGHRLKVNWMDLII